MAYLPDLLTWSFALLDAMPPVGSIIDPTGGMASGFLSI